MLSSLPLFLLSGLTAAAAYVPVSLHHRQAVTCWPGVYLIVARGTFEAAGTFGFQQPVVDAILSKIPNSNATSVDYPANTDVNTSVPIGAANTQKLMTDYYNACPTNKMALMGYSQGAIVIGNALAGGPTYVPIFGSTGPGPAAVDPVIGQNVVAIVQFGDLNRVEGQGIDGEVDDKPCKVNSTYPRNGTVLTNMQIYSDRIDEFCAEGDGACCSTGLNFFAHTGYYTNGNIQAASNFVLGKFNGTL